MTVFFSLFLKLHVMNPLKLSWLPSVVDTHVTGLFLLTYYIYFFGNHLLLSGHLRVKRQADRERRDGEMTPACLY